MNKIELKVNGAKVLNLFLKNKNIVCGDSHGVCYRRYRVIYRYLISGGYL